MIRVENLVKSYGGILAVDDLSFSVGKGELVGFLGPNGAGKTTTMRILSCYLPATSGVVEISGHDVFADSIAVRQRIGYLPENVPLYSDMRVSEYLVYRGHLKGMHGKRLRSRTADVVEMCELGDVRTRIIGQLSKGFRQRIGLADALLNEPDVLILDEPTIGLDPNQIRNVRNLIKRLGGQHTVLLSSHILAEVEMTCQRVLIINRGRIVASDTPVNLAGALKGNMQVMVEIKADSREVCAELGKIQGVVRVSCLNEGPWGSFMCETTRGVDPRGDIFNTASRKGWQLRELREEKRNLEDIFVALTGDYAERLAGNEALTEVKTA
jgi:ABC-2 type transport system ATP-binding protein